MEIIIPDISYDNKVIEHKDLIKEIKKDINSFSKEYVLREVDIGKGASLPAILGIIAIAIALPGFLESSLNLAKKFKAFFKKTKSKYGNIRICEKCASLIAINYINKREKKIRSIENIYNYIISINLPKKDGVYLEGLSENPDAFYLQNYKVNDNIFYLFNIKSDGEIKLNYKFNLPKWYDF